MTRTKLFIAGAGLLGLALGLYALNPDSPVISFVTGFLAGVCGITGAICLGYDVTPVSHPAITRVLW